MKKTVPESLVSDLCYILYRVCASPAAKTRLAATKVSVSQTTPKKALDVNVTMVMREYRAVSKSLATSAGCYFLGMVFSICSLKDIAVIL